jgi:hypothetical protein
VKVTTDAKFRAAAGVRTADFRGRSGLDGKKGGIYGTLSSAKPGISKIFLDI